MAHLEGRKRIRESNLNSDQVKLAVPALYSFLEKTSKQSKKLFDENASFWLLVSLKKIPGPDKKPKLINVPHPFHEDTEVCLFSKLPGKQVKEQLKSKGVTNITKVISVPKLRKNFKSFQDKRNLCSQYGVFLCDERIYHLLPKLLGKTFFDRKKEPTPVNLRKIDLAAEINSALSSTKVRLGHGTCSAIKVGHSGQLQEQIVENVIAVVSQIAKKVPRGWNNIQCIHLKTSESVALPLFNSLPDLENIIETQEPPQKKKKSVMPTKKKVKEVK